ncbi:ATP-binding cassette transporter ABC1 [Pseudovirgaria hyperparasitica]|uniref:ATP-binding cassette transporter ABC1 n=1 Tax=Pseudovirgaria hyperparasitica TaxID=470096 RepID=A0A6A6WHA3_9PEZI|nr:ATP-binding cassette transporter ABC1 [Pseudovirgaria hyperparasitica]KAF2761450.1 ATP-binding cassette transporter ABC1 [Pseudovirgaria hyperparasitica]
MAHPGSLDSQMQSSSTEQTPVNEYVEPKEEVESINSSDDSDAAYASIVKGSQNDPAATSRRNSEAMITDSDRDELRRIVTALSRRQSSFTDGLSRTNTVSGLEDNDPVLDPNSKSFDLGKWIRKFMQHFEAEGVTPKRTGVLYRNLNVSGTGSAVQLQGTVGSILMAPLRLGELLSFGKKEHKQILQNFDGVVKSGELLIVLGRPGSGCSTLLKTMTGQLHGLELDPASTIHYNGIDQKQMIKEFRGETIYNQEVDRHFPHLTVGQTLEFAASARTPSHRVKDMSREEMSQHVAKVVMAVFGLSHTYNTKVGDDFIRGVSGGERKRVSIAEMVLAGSPMGAWDNSTRGLDSATALKFVQALRMASDFSGATSAVAIYQASQAIYDVFDKATVLYEGRQIYFGPASKAKAFFERQGWLSPQRQTTGDFLTSVTNASERKPREGMEDKVPRTPEDFERYWRESPEYKELQSEMDSYEKEYPLENSGAASQLREQQQYLQAKHVRKGSPYTINTVMQVRLCTRRAYQRVMGDKSATVSQSVMNLILALIIGSVFFGTPNASGGFFAKGSVLFMAALLNALTAIGEINSLYAQRPIVEKHASYAFYHPATEAAAGIVLDIPVKFVVSTIFNIVLYFMAGLRVEPAQFFLYFLITYLSTFVMSAIFRTMAALTKTVSQAMALSGVLVLALVIYTGFVIAVPQMHPWFSWIRWINPLFYAFEILIANEFHGRQFECSSFVPSYMVGDSFICSIVGAVAGQTTVSGDSFIEQNYQYYYSHVWRNFGILIAFLVFFMAIYFVAVEFNSSMTSTAEVLVFQRGRVPAALQKGAKQASPDEEMANGGEVKGNSDAGEVKAIEPQKDIFTWRDVVYDIEVKDGSRRLLDNVSGWVKPGTLTALMGVSGAGKTTLLDVLAQRTTMGVITGDMLVNGKPLDASFQRKTGYVQQQDLHLETATVRESLRFSAMLRQPKTVSKQEKYDFVEEVIDMLNMRDFADAVVGVPGQGLNVEQRKLLTIGVELSAKPKLLLFLDEPTSGLDSQSSWAICSFLRKLADAGQAVLCTVHQPSAILFQEFDRLLFLAKGGKTVYFGEIGENSRTLLDYFESNGGRKCDDEENPAEYMLEIVNNGTNDQGEDWFDVWKQSENCQAVGTEIDRIHSEKQHEAVEDDGADSHSEFAMPFTTQLIEVTWRVTQQYWRMPSYIGAKFALGIAAGLFIGFTFYGADATQAGMQNVIFSVFMLTTIFSTLVQQIQPLFITQRALYEVRERPSKAYSWKAFVIANIFIEIPWQVIVAIVTWASYYYAVIGIQSSARQGLVLLFVIQLFIYASSFAHMTIAALPDAQTASGLVTLGTLMSTLFCGVLQSPDALPGFWIFMYRVSPFTYWVGGISGTQLHERAIECSAAETSQFDPPANTSCGDYMRDYLAVAPGYLRNPEAMTNCQYCPLSNGDQYLAGSNIYYSERWRDYGIMWAFIGFNITMAVLTYYLFRVKKWNMSGFSLPKGKGKKGKKTSEGKEKVEAGVKDGVQKAANPINDKEAV